MNCGEQCKQFRGQGVGYGRQAEGLAVKGKSFGISTTIQECTRCNNKFVDMECSFQIDENDETGFKTLQMEMSEVVGKIRDIFFNKTKPKTE